MWSYKVEVIKQSYDNLDSNMNEYGQDNWEIFKIDELLRTNEESKTGMPMFTFRFYMKKKV